MDRPVQIVKLDHARVKAVNAHRAVDIFKINIAAAAFQFPLTHPNVVSVIPGMASRAQLEWNVARMTQTIPASLWEDLKTQGLLRPDAPVPNEAVEPVAGPAGSPLHWTHDPA